MERKRTYPGATFQPSKRGAFPAGGLSRLVGAASFVSDIVYQVVFAGTATTATGAGPVFALSTFLIFPLLSGWRV